MSRTYRNLGPETLELVETAPLPLLQEILAFRGSETEPLVEFEWPECSDDDEGDDLRANLLDQLNAKAVEVLRPLEDRCGRIRRLSLGKGPSSLEHVAQKRLSHEEHETFTSQLDPLCRSGWIFLRHPADFEDAEAFLAARQYRDHGKLYDSFEVKADDPSAATDSEAIDADALASLLTAKLELPSRVSIRTLDLPKTGSHPASVMVIVRHAGPLSSVLSHKDNGMRGTIYYRPPNEATLIWTPTLGTIEICGPSPQVRKKAADSFAEVVLKADLSNKPLSWRYYDLTRFHHTLMLPLPVWDDVEISRAQLIEVEMRLGDWSRRLSLRVTIDDDIETVARQYLGGSTLLKRAEGFSRLVVAVHYARPGDQKQRTLEISFGDRRSNVQSKHDPDERDLGYRLLQFWGVMNKLRVLESEEIAQLLPALLELHDLPEDEISGGHLRRIGLDPKRLHDAGILALQRRQNIVLVDDADDFGDVSIAAGDRPGEVTAIGTFGEDLGGLPIEDVRKYIIKRDWLEETLLAVLKSLIGRASVQQLDADLAYLGRWRADGTEIPIYFARRLGQSATLQRLDALLRSRQDGGVGIVLTAAQTPFTHLGPNVVIPLADVLYAGVIGDEAQAAILVRFRASGWVARGGSEVALHKFGHQSGMLHMPGKVPLAIAGPKQMMIIDRFVAAHRAGRPDVPTGEIVEGTGVRSPADAWRSEARKTIMGIYFENNRRGHWRLKTDGICAAV
ncbi:hypothetical protein H5395_17430 [Paracoccus sp. MC1854]|uniref:hypothetical protein n=1 Tax=Paracoccus sp. MC1854 TaxID=2760306 RepID=UPI0016010C51|nr:hypothetical protein [Paracoccus sp. MC1854]MBB1493239.1 hypothetical protein [Paracoccus sp. MC1854]